MSLWQYTDPDREVLLMIPLARRPVCKVWDDSTRRKAPGDWRTLQTTADVPCAQELQHTLAMERVIAGCLQSCLANE